MPHKHNPMSAILADACARHVRANAAVLFESTVQELERAAGAWHAEWHALATALAATGGAAAAIHRSLDGLQVNAERMRANVTDETLSEAGRLGVEVSAPDDYLGATGVFVDRALALYRG
jgi:3-carboxy-cis,cis-muconate cycloisomerase